MKVRITDMETGKAYTTDCATFCQDDTDRSVFEEVVRSNAAIQMGSIVGHPVKEERTTVTVTRRGMRKVQEWTNVLDELSAGETELTCPSLYREELSKLSAFLKDIVLTSL